jgi:putative transposase
MINFNYCYKLKSTKQQAKTIEDWLRTCYGVDNFALAERKDWLKSPKSSVDRCSLVSEYIISSETPCPNYNNQGKSLTQAKNKYQHLNRVHSQGIQQVLKTLDKVFSEMTKKGDDFPRFKKKLRTFVFPSIPKKWFNYNNIKRKKIGKIILRTSRPYPTTFLPKTAHIIKEASTFYVIIYLTRIPYLSATGRGVSI